MSQHEAQIETPIYAEQPTTLHASNPKTSGLLHSQCENQWRDQSRGSRQYRYNSLRVLPIIRDQNNPVNTRLSIFFSYIRKLI